MGADAFHVFYGLRWEIASTEESILEALEDHSDPRVLAAKEQSLEHWWGQTEEEERHFLLIGACVGQFGWEHHESGLIRVVDLQKIERDVNKRLRAAGFSSQAALHFQFEPDR